MKTKKEMYQQDSGKAPVTFCDVAAYFSEEEWKLLHEWQKELYSNVMKAVHQALMSMGPVIATSVFSLKPKEKEYLYPADLQDSERRDENNQALTYPSVGADIVLRMDQDVETSLIGDQDSKGREISIAPNAGHEAIMQSIPFGINKKGETYAMASHGSERSKNSSSSTGFPSFNTKSEAKFMDDIDADGGACSLGVSLGEEMITPVIPFQIKEEGEAHFMELRDSYGTESTSVSTGANTSTRSTEQLQGNSWERASISSDCGRRFINKLDNIKHHNSKQLETSDAYAECSRSFSQRTTPVKQTGTHKEQRPYTWTEFEKSFIESTPMNPHQQMNTGLKHFICSHCGNSFNQSTIETVQHGINKLAHPTTCSECEKSLSQTTNVFQDQAKDLVEKPYSCILCGKSFRKSQSLLIHQRVHTGEKPYTCSQCGKNFRQVQHLVKHRRLHTGEKPYACNFCERRFINSSNLKRHQLIHTRVLQPDKRGQRRNRNETQMFEIHELEN